jgi:hypothetical protein
MEACMSDLALPTAAAPRAEARPGRLNPYLVGAGIGVLSWVVFVVVAAPIGITTAGSQIAGGVAALAVGQEAVDANSYWARHPFRLDYGTLFLVGTFLGALASSLANRTFRFETVPAVWRERFGGSVPLRFAAAFLGGAIAMFGARLANGCTSGNGISQGLQLALVGWVFLAAMFVSGLVTAWLLFRKS